MVDIAPAAVDDCTPSGAAGGGQPICGPCTRANRGPCRAAGRLWTRCRRRPDTRCPCRARCPRSIEHELLDDGAGPETARLTAVLGQPIEKIEQRGHTLYSASTTSSPQASLIVLRITAPRLWFPRGQGF
ncbi:hypothetical protein GCM10022244_30170 [Streptomyces gulbargensis]|uniref:Uncharacterized protein n=1 Tax=Streptomyces gulbargensis TaxID=364901 RepID=A0ABP7MDR9_9ACTN